MRYMNRVCLSLLLFTHLGLLPAVAKDAVKPDYKAAKDTWESICKAATAGQKNRAQGFVGQTITLEALRIASTPDLCLIAQIINIDDPNPPMPVTNDKRWFTVSVRGTHLSAGWDGWEYGVHVQDTIDKANRQAPAADI